MKGLRKSLAVMVTAVMLLALVPAVALAVEEDTVGGTFSINAPPSITSVNLWNTSGPAEVTAMTPQVEFDVRVKVTDADGLTDLDTIVVKIYYDNSVEGTTEAEFDAVAAGDAQTAIIITWTQGGTFVLTEETDSSWDLGTGVVGTADSATAFQFKFTVGKVATESFGGAADDWQIAAKVTDDAAQTDWAADAEGSTMAWYGEIDVPTATVDWGTINPGMTFAEGDPSEEALGVTVNYISNGAYDEKVKSDAVWTSAGAAPDADLALDGVTNVAQEFALKADDTGTLTSAVVVNAAGVVIDDAANALWLQLNATFEKDVYSGTITYIIADGS